MCDGRLQVNPHVVPFLRSIKSSSRFSVLHQIAMLMGAEILHRVKQLAELGWWPKYVPLIALTDRASLSLPFFFFFS